MRRELVLTLIVVILLFIGFAANSSRRSSGGHRTFANRTTVIREDKPIAPDPTVTPARARDREVHAPPPPRVGASPQPTIFLVNNTVPPCYVHSPVPPIVLWNPCETNEVKVPQMCLEPGGERLANEDRVAIISYGANKSVATDLEWMPNELGRVIPYYVYDNTHWPAEQGWRPNPFVRDRTVRLGRGFHRGNEADMMLYYILANYDCLPRVTVFLHTHRENAHSFRYMNGQGNVTANLDATIPDILSHVCWDKVTSYYSMTPIVFQLGNGHNNIAFTDREWAKFLPDVHKEVFPTKILSFHCCANFMVHRDAIRRRPRQFYYDVLKYLTDNPPYDFVNGAAPMGYIWEYSWEYVFGVHKEVNLPELFDHTCCQWRQCLCAKPQWPAKNLLPPHEVFGC